MAVVTVSAKAGMGDESRVYDVVNEFLGHADERFATCEAVNWSVGRQTVESFSGAITKLMSPSN